MFPPSPGGWRSKRKLRQEWCPVRPLFLVCRGCLPAVSSYGFSSVHLLLCCLSFYNDTSSIGLGLYPYDLTKPNWRPYLQYRPMNLGKVGPMQSITLSFPFSLLKQLLLHHFTEAGLTQVLQNLSVTWPSPLSGSRTFPHSTSRSLPRDPARRKDFKL